MDEIDFTWPENVFLYRIEIIKNDNEDMAANVWWEIRQMKSGEVGAGEFFLVGQALFSMDENPTFQEILKTSFFPNCYEKMKTLGFLD